VATIAPADPALHPDDVDRAAPAGEAVIPAGRAEPAGRPWTAVGPRDAPAILFIHSTRLSRRQWMPQLRRLSGRFRCVAVDLPGHGAQADVPFTIAAAVATVSDAIELEAADGRALVVGLSLGGYIAIDVADARPDLVAGLVLAGCSAEPVGPGAMPFRAFAWLMEHLSPRALRVLNLAFFRVRYRGAVAGPIVDGGFWSAAGATAVRQLLGRRYLWRLWRLWTPVVIVNGGLDPVFGPGGEPWAAACRRGRHVVIPWALHLSNLDRPRTFSNAVAAAADEAFAPR
jgi:pimeloyl-ACP methyl ester carboxylesterase